MFNHIKHPDRPRAERLLGVLADGRWHPTRELVRRVGHTFAGAKFALVRDGYEIDRRPHGSRRRQHEYRLVRVPRTGYSSRNEYPT